MEMELKGHFLRFLLLLRKFLTLALDWLSCQTWK